METPKNTYKIGKIRTDHRKKIIAIAEMEFAEIAGSMLHLTNKTTKN